MLKNNEKLIILNPQSKKKAFKKIEYKNYYLNSLLLYFIFIFILIVFVIIAFIIILKKGIIRLKLANKNYSKNNYSKNIKKNEKIDKLNNFNKISLNENYSEIISFNQDINKKYINSQNKFCDHQNIFVNKDFEDKIKLVTEIKFNDKKFNMFVYRNSDSVSKGIIKNKSWEKDETNKLIRALHFYSNKNNIKKEDIYFIDIGANIGWYSYIIGLYGYKVISFEPSKINYYILKKTYCLNNGINISIINKGLYTEEKICFLYSHRNNQGNGHLIWDQKKLPHPFIKRGEIILTKLSNYLSFFNKENLVLIKMDIEGSEAKAIEGGIELITKYHVPFIFFEFTPHLLKEQGSDPKSFLQLFADNGYKFSIIDFFNNHISINDIIEKNYTQINLYVVYSKILE